MKRTILMILFILIPCNVFAEETERKFRFYYIEKHYSNAFYEVGKNPEEYPYISDTWIYSNETKTSLEKLEPKEDLIKEIPTIRYQEKEKVRYVIIDQIYSDFQIDLNEIEVYNKDEKLEYQITCNTCQASFCELIKNSKTSYEYNTIANNSELLIDLQQEYFPDDLIIKLYLSGTFGKYFQIRITLNNTKDLTDNYYRFNIHRKLMTYLEISTNIKDVKHEERYSEEIKELENVETIENAKIINKYTKFKYKIRLYQYYKEHRHYIDGYYKDLPGLIKDEDNYIENIKKEEINSNNTINDISNQKVQNETLKIEYLTKEVFVPIIREKIKYQEKEVKVEIPKETETIIEKEIIKPEKENFLLSYSIYLLFTIVLRKMSLFKG